MNESLSVHDRLRDLRTALLTHRLDGSGELFHSRDLLRELGEWIGESAFASLQPLLELALEILGQVIRHDGLAREDSLCAVEGVLEFVDASLKRAAADRPQALDMAGPQSEVAGPGSDLVRTGFRRPLQVDGSRSARVPPPQATIRLDSDAVDETRLGEILLQMKLVVPADLTRALGLQQITRRRLGDILLAMGVVDEFRLRDALERQRYATLRMAQGHSAVAGGGVELQVADPDLLNQVGRQDRGWPDAR